MRALTTTEERAHTEPDRQKGRELGPTARRAARLLRITDVADTLGLSRSKVYELLATGELTSVSIGRARRVSETALEEFIERLEGEHVA